MTQVLGILTIVLLFLLTCLLIFWWMTVGGERKPKDWEEDDLQDVEYDNSR